MTEREDKELERSHPIVRGIKRLFALVVVLALLAVGGAGYGWVSMSWHYSGTVRLGHPGMRIRRCRSVPGAASCYVKMPA